jgi:hypothetical protein
MINRGNQADWQSIRKSISEALLEEFDSVHDQLLLSEISSEWKAICYRFGLKLVIPCFRIGDTEAILGSWDRGSRTITIARSAICNLSWDSVVSLLKHEMAHQYVDERLGVQNCPDHGADFRIACDRLGILSPFRSSNLKLDEIREKRDQAPSLPDSLKRKLSRLEALAASSNHHESGLARERMQSIRASLAELAGDFSAADQAGFARKVVSLGKRRVSRDQALAAGILSGYFGVEVIFDDEFDIKAMCRNKTIVILGRSDRLEMAEFVFHFLIDEARRAWHGYRLNTHAAARESASFRAGVIEGFRSALKTAGNSFKQGARQSKSNNSEQHQVMVDCDESNSGLQQFVTSQFPRLRSQTVSSSLASARAQREGAEVGKKIMLPRPVGSGAKSSVQLLRSSDS